MTRQVAITAVGAQMGGARRHLTGFVPALAALPDWRFEIFCAPEAVKWVDGVPGNVQLTPAASPALGSIGRVWWDQVVLGRLLAQRQPDLLVSLLNFGPARCAMPQINFQRNPLYYCDYYFRNIGSAERTLAKLRRWLCILAMRNSARVVTPSAGMWQMIKRYVPKLSDELSVVLPHAVDAPARTVPGKIVHLPAGAPRPWLLYPSHAAPHKGFDVLLRTARQLRESGTRFTLILTIEEQDWPGGVRAIREQIESWNLQDCVQVLGRLSQAEMIDFYPRVDLVVFPSLCESFGFPIVEAMACGRPVVAAGTAVNREVGGAGASYYAAEDAQDAANAIRAALQDAGAAARAQRHFNGFDWSWARYVRDFGALMQGVIN